VAIENQESVFFNRHGQYIYSEPRGRHAVYDVSKIGIYKGKLHQTRYRAVCER